MSSVASKSGKSSKGCSDTSEEKNDEKEDEGKKKEEKTMKDVSWLKMEDENRSSKGSNNAEVSSAAGDDASSFSIGEDGSTASQRKGYYQLSRLAVKRTIQVAKIVNEFAVDLNKDLVNDDSQTNCKLVITKLRHILEIGRSKLNYIETLIDDGVKTNASRICPSQCSRNTTEQVVLDSEEGESNSLNSCNVKFGLETDTIVKETNDDTVLKGDTKKEAVSKQKSSEDSTTDRDDDNKPSVMIDSKNSDDEKDSKSSKISSVFAKSGVKTDSKNSDDEKEYKSSKKSSVVAKSGVKTVSKNSDDEKESVVDKSRDSNDETVHSKPVTNKRKSSDDEEDDPVVNVCGSIDSSEDEPMLQDGDNGADVNTTTDDNAVLTEDTLYDVALGITKKKSELSNSDDDDDEKMSEIDKSSVVAHDETAVNETISSTEEESPKKPSKSVSKVSNRRSTVVSEGDTNSDNDEAAKKKKKTKKGTTKGSKKRDDSTMERDSSDNDFADRVEKDPDNTLPTEKSEEQETDEKTLLSQSLKVATSADGDERLASSSSDHDETDVKAGKSSKKSEKTSDDDNDNDDLSLTADLAEKEEETTKKKEENKNDIAREELNKLLDADTSDASSVSRPSTPVKKRRLTKSRKKKHRGSSSDESDVNKKSCSLRDETKKSKGRTLKPISSTMSSKKSTRVRGTNSSNSDKSSLSTSDSDHPHRQNDKVDEDSISQKEDSIKKSKSLLLKKSTTAEDTSKKVNKSSTADKSLSSSNSDHVDDGDDDDNPVPTKGDSVESVATCSSASKFIDPKLNAELKVVVEKMDPSSLPPYVPSKKSENSDSSDLTDSDVEFAKLISMKGLKKKKKTNGDGEGKSKRKSKTDTKRGAKKRGGSTSSSDNESDNDKGSDDEAKAGADSPAFNSSDTETPMKSKKDLARDALAAVLDSTEEDFNDTEEDEKPKKNIKKRNRTDESESDFEKQMESLKSKKKNDSDSSDDFVPSFSRKTRSRCAILSARISSDSDSNVSKKQKKTTERKRKKKDSSNDSETSDSDESIGAKKKRPTKRRRIKKMADSSDEDDSDVKIVDGEDKASGGQGDTPTSKGRKNIRKVLKDSRLQSQTKQAAKEEEERRKRVLSLQKLYNEVVEEGPDGNKVPITTKLVLAVDKETQEPLLSVHPNLIKKLKPHQVEGVKFMWESTCESMDRIKEHPGSGCILAHCMGLGKTLQVITYVHTLLKSESTGLKTCLVVCPLNTVLNWFSEFKYWLEDTMDDDDEPIEISELTTVRNTYQRVYALRNWIEDGGVMIMGYEMFRNFANEKAKRVTKNQRMAFQKALVDPGPDLVICDEGHILKNSRSALSMAMDRIRTKRRVILTGTPLQNNLEEYHCMVSFVKPNLLGTLKEFQNRFMNPINNGQCADSTQGDVRLMKRRAHILHNLLDGCVQRRDYAVLVPFLQPKHEYVISIRLTEAQIKLYSHYMEHFARKGVKSGLFADYTVLCRVWTHPWVLRLAQIREQNKATYDSESSFIDDEESSSESSCISIESDDDNQPTTSRGKKKNDSGDEEVIKGWTTRRRNGIKEEEKVKEEPEEVKKDESVDQEGVWWNQFVSEEDATKVELSGKVVILFDILKECEAIGDKVLLFSQSLLSLDLLEDMLQRCGKEFIGSTWTNGLDYFRLDGSTSADLRMRYTRLFNDEEEYRARLFLISTRAGSLGINLVSANRVVIFDASWNPTHDVQSIFRVYRFGQKKPVYIYRLLAQGTMEEKIYDRQVTKLSLSIRVLDEQQVDRHFNYADLQELYNFEPDSVSKRPIPLLPKDRLLADILIRHKDRIVNYHEHDSLLVNVQEEELSEEDRKAAWVEYEAERKGLVNDAVGMGAQYKIDVAYLIENIQQKHPGLSIEELNAKLATTVKMVVEAKKQQMLQQQQQQLQQQQQWKMQIEQMKMQHQQQQQQQYSQQYQQQQQRFNNPNIPNFPNLAQLANLRNMHPAMANHLLQTAFGQMTRQPPKSTVTIEEIIE